ncbi:phosphate ABC transporter, permease protein PstC [Pyrobaculum oguniense TE7]|uniref:Phosphate transport system permease protein n=1 Tax=Pyrobaculum oguniense (strain DSM 13380 / JCM 10595 / TE7) TaxID=698757 RepID=H6QCH9_PYROT|nr:phosphate ABC transporter, permease protein PstC [Pyrobaculum oguniense TE7]
MAIFLVLFITFYLLSAFTLLFIKTRWGLRLIAAINVAIIAALVATFAWEALPLLERDGLAVFVNSDWDPPRESYGVLNALVGTLITSAIAITVAMPLAVGVAVTINEMLPQRLRGVFGALNDLTAAMPTVIYGLWGLFVLGPVLQSVVNTVSTWLGFGEVMTAPLTLFTAAILLAIMITPYAAAVIREGYALVPRHIEEAIYAIGATKFEAVLVKLRYVKNYIFGGLFLALGRAMGETVAVAMVVGGNFARFTLNPFESGITISSLIALQFPNAHSYQFMVPALFAGALLLAVVGLAINAVAIYILQRATT